MLFTIPLRIIFALAFAFNPGKRYTFGNISVEQDSTSPQHINPDVILRHLDFKNGEYYGEQKKVENERNLNRLGIFETAKIENAVIDTSSETTAFLFGFMYQPGRFRS